MLYAELNKSEKTISIKGEPDSTQLLLNFLIVGDKGESVDLKHVDFGYQLKTGGRVVLEETWPIPGIRFGLQKPGSITVANQEIEMSTDYHLLVWYGEDGHRSTDSLLFNSGMPPKEYESMIWNEELRKWDYLKPYPEVETDEPIRYFWNEHILDWEEDVEYKEFYSNPENAIIVTEDYLEDYS